MKRTLFRTGRQVAAVVLALGLVVATAGPSAAGCLRHNDRYIICVG